MSDLVLARKREMAAIICAMGAQAIAAAAAVAPAPEMSSTETFWSSTAPSVIAAATVASRQRPGAALKRRHISAMWAEYLNVNYTSESEWVAMFRLPRAVFNEVVDNIEAHECFRAPRNIGERKLSVDKQLAIFLMRVGSALPIHDIRKKMGVSESSVTTSTRRVARAVISAFGHLLRMPVNGSARKAQVAAMFAATDFHAAAGIIDCTHVLINVPTEDRRKGVHGAYLDRKGRATLTYQAIVTPEATPRFLDVSGGVPGSAYDTRLLERSTVYKNLLRHLEPGQYLMGDCGYPLRPWMMRGWSPSELKAKGFITQERWRFNKRYSSTRISVERAFGILVRRAGGARRHVRARRLTRFSPLSLSESEI